MMRRCFLVILLCCLLVHPNDAAQQTTNSTTEQQLENLTDAAESETEDDSYLQELDYYLKNPLNLNEADEDDLKELRILSGLQISSFLRYRRLIGNLVSIYELQAIPDWDMITIRKILPYVLVAPKVTVGNLLSQRFRDGDHSLLVRYSQIMERSRGYDQSGTGTKYAGGPQRLFFRYRYQFRNTLQFGLLGDKDAGEQFFKGAQRQGFDFYSFHFFARDAGKVKVLALGDFTVNLGQGLIQWQSLAFRKSVDVTGIKRQSPVLRPYNSAGEYNFHRGAGVTIKSGRLETTEFISLRKLSANLGTDTVSREDFFSSVITSGYHRTPGEIADKNNVSQVAAGGNLKFSGDNFHVGINTMNYFYSSDLKKRDEPYNLYAISGNQWSNHSLDYSYTGRNFHFSGEAAMDRHLHKAFISGLLLSVDPKADLSIIYRNISSRYQSINGNAFTENTYPTNEKGLFTGISVRPLSSWRIEAYADLFSFPWLKYLVDAPSGGSEYLVQLTYSPNRILEFYTRYRSETKQKNLPENQAVTNILISIPKKSWRTQFNYRLSPAVRIKSRSEIMWYDKVGVKRETGFLLLFDLFYNPPLKNFSTNFRVQYFETEGYNGRIYAYENDVLWYYSVPAFFNRGTRYYLNINYDLSKNISCWLKWSQTHYFDQDTIGSGLDEINGSKKSELRIQFRIIF